MARRTPRFVTQFTEDIRRLQNHEDQTMLNDFPTEKVVLAKADGSTHEVVGHLQPKLFVTMSISPPIDEGDILERALPNGRVERYEVTEANFYPKSGVGGPHYQCELRKTTSRKGTMPSPSQINVTGNNARINIASGQSSSISDASNYNTESAGSISDSWDRDKWEHDVVDVLKMLVSGKEELEADFGDIRAAIGKLTQIDTERVNTSGELQLAVDAQLTAKDKTALSKLRTLSATVATNIVSSGLWETVIGPLLQL